MVLADDIKRHRLISIVPEYSFGDPSKCRMTWYSYDDAVYTFVIIVITVWFISKLDVKRPVCAAAGGVSTSGMTVHGPATELADARTKQDK